MSDYVGYGTVRYLIFKLIIYDIHLSTVPYGTGNNIMVDVQLISFGYRSVDEIPIFFNVSNKFWTLHILGTWRLSFFYCRANFEQHSTYLERGDCLFLTAKLILNSIAHIWSMEAVFFLLSLFIHTNYHNVSKYVKHNIDTYLHNYIHVYLHTTERIR